MALIWVTHLYSSSGFALQCWFCLFKSNVFPSPPHGLPYFIGKWASLWGTQMCSGVSTEMRVAGQCWCDAPLLPGGFPMISLSAWWSSPWWSYLKILFPLLWFQTKLLHKHWDKGFNWLALAWGSVTGFWQYCWVMLVLCALAKANVIGKLTFSACQRCSVFLIKGYSLFN